MSGGAQRPQARGDSLSPRAWGHISGPPTMVWWPSHGTAARMGALDRRLEQELGKEVVMSTRRLVAAASVLGVALAAAPMGALHSQTPAQDSAANRTWRVNPGA